MAAAASIEGSMLDDTLEVRQAIASRNEEAMPRQSSVIPMQWREPPDEDFVLLLNYLY
jgi:hypothetical protein